MRRNPKFFLLIIAVVTLLFLIFNLPSSFTIPLSKVPTPGTTLRDLTVDPTKIDIGIGPLRINRDLAYRLGLDLQGGVRLVYELDMNAIPAVDRQTAFDSARDIIERRINFFGVSEPTIQTIRSGNSYRVAVELPGVTDVTAAQDLIGKTAQLTFWEAGSETASDIEATSSAYPFGMVQLLEGKKPVKTKLSGKDLKSAVVGFNQNNAQPEVQLTFTSEGTKLFGDITKRNIGKPVVIVLDDQIIQAPNVNEAILTGSAVITGGFTTNTAKSFAIQLNAGALPVPLTIVAQSNIGPSLGIESLKKSLFAGLLGFLSVVIFMIYLYRKEGLLASIALFVYVVITLFVFKLIPVTITLAGIAGFILSIGMAVDANILIFERMREELRAGKSRDVAIEVGFHRAWSSIRDSNISSLLTSAILFYFGTGIVRGFALTLAIGIFISMFSAITVTRTLLRVFDQGRKK